MEFRRKKIFQGSFDIYASDYQSVRPSYPIQLYHDLQAVCQISQDSKMIEIGAGTGIATEELAKTGANIVALEPGENLAKIAKERLDGHENVSIVCDTFENYQHAEKFDVALAFTSFHWLTDEKYQKINNMLNSDGKLVIVWNSFMQSDSDVVSRIDELYQKHLPDVYPSTSSTSEVNSNVIAKLTKRIGELVANPEFQVVYLNEYVTAYEYDKDTYPKLLNTFPKIINIANKEQKDKFLKEVSAVVAEHSKITVPILSTLIVLQFKEDFIRTIIS
ncbi:MAG: class I SAM-dependent methyltransferase [Oscillospiraceae bacterium]|nr:class I SAM-dependent methyltransferase [Oscillospiraceae bacterium]